jgi:hypothetical protein
MLAKLKRTAARHLTNLPGWRTNRKIVVIESDDWGSIRMPSREVYERLLNAGITVDRCPYNKYDSLASEEDLSALFEVLTMFRDKNGNPPIITANTVVANPDFEKIQASGYKEYFYEPFTETLRKYPAHQNAFKLWKEGISSGVFYPQFHGREHVNIPLWLSLLQENHETFKLAFENRLWGLGPEIVNTGKINIQAAFDTKGKIELANQQNSVVKGLSLFESLFGFKSQSFIANNFIWDSGLEPVLKSSGVSVIQGMKYQKLPLFEEKKRKMIRHYLGEKNDQGQVYLIRNCIFEPTWHSQSDNVSSCLKDIANAFFWKKPAIITSHRVNFIGHVFPDNRKKNLELLKVLIQNVLKIWPDVEFLTSAQLGDEILASYLKVIVVTKP